MPKRTLKNLKIIIKNQFLIIPYDFLVFKNLLFKDIKTN